MKVIGLVSGGKDSCYNMVQCVAAGHEIIALANLKPKDSDCEEIDSQMYQSVGSSVVEYIAKAMELPFYVDTICGTGKSVGKDYQQTQGDEVEDLYNLLARVKDETGAEAVSVGAILSDYQRVRVESVCLRLNLVPLAYLWRRNQAELLREMIEVGMESVLIKVACLGLDKKHLGLTLEEMETNLLDLQSKYGVNVCGEGGEYETYTLDCPLFRKKLKIVDRFTVSHSTDPFAPVFFLHLEVDLEDKDLPDGLTQEQLLSHHVSLDLSPSAYVKEIIHAKEGMCNDVQGCKFSTSSYEVKRDHPKEGWFDVLHVPGFGSTPAQGIISAFDTLKSVLDQLDTDLTCLARIILYIGDMENYACINEEYVKNFGLNPPVRICVAVGKRNLQGGAEVCMSARGWIGSKDRSCLHVQGISHWAPSNIGPYSQAVRAGSLVHVSGQIALVPGSMQLTSDPSRELDLSFRHVLRVSEAVEPGVQASDIVEAVCYISHPCYASSVHEYWKRKSKGKLNVILVESLPRKANYEWEVIFDASAERI